MKLKPYLLMMAVALFMAACSDDDDNNDVPNLAKEIADTYNGYTTTNSNVIPGEKVAITANTDGTANISFESLNTLKYNISNVEITFSNDVYTIKKTEGKLSGPENALLVTDKCTVEGTISKDKKTVSLIFEVTGGSKLTFTNGDAPANLAVQGEYKGYSVGKHKYSSIPDTAPGETINITATEDGKVNMLFQSVGKYGKINITGATATLKDNAYEVEGSGKALLGMGAGDPTEYDCTVKATISSDKKTVSIVFIIPVPMGGITVTFTQGEAPANMLIAAVYEGPMTMKVGETSAGSVEKQKVTIKSQDNEKAEVTLAEFTATMMGKPTTIKDIVIPDVEIAVEAGTYTLTGTIDTMSDETPITGTLTGTIKDGKADLVFAIKPGAMPMNIMCTYTGEK